MKTRAGFVSNSSSSSYCISGFGLLFNETKKFLEFLFDNKLDIPPNQIYYSASSLEEAIHFILDEYEYKNETKLQSFFKDIYADKETYMEILEAVLDNTDELELISDNINNIELEVFRTDGNYYVYLSRPPMDGITIEKYAQLFSEYLEEIRKLQDRLSKKYKLFGIDNEFELY